MIDRFHLSGLLSRAVATPLGRKLMYTWHLRPLFDLKMIEERHNAVEMFLHPDHQHNGSEIRRAMRQVGNVLAYCQRIFRGREGPSDWRRLLEVSHLQKAR